MWLVDWCLGLMCLLFRFGLCGWSVRSAVLCCWCCIGGLFLGWLVLGVIWWFYGCFRLCALPMFANLVLVLFLGLLVAWCNLLRFSDARDFVV